MNRTVFLLLRLGIGISMFGHGIVRVPKLAAFTEWMVGSMAKSMLPESLVRPFGYILPILELAVGVLLLLGLFTEMALIGGGVVMLMLLFGTSLAENWEALPSQLIHLAYFALLLQFVASNSWAVYKMLRK